LIRASYVKIDAPTLRNEAIEFRFGSDNNVRLCEFTGILVVNGDAYLIVYCLTISNNLI